MDSTYEDGGAELDSDEGDREMKDGEASGGEVD